MARDVSGKEVSAQGDRASHATLNEFLCSVTEGHMGLVIQPPSCFRKIQSGVECHPRHEVWSFPPTCYDPFQASQQHVIPIENMLAVLEGLRREKDVSQAK